jgi:hypothetical protein
MAAAALMMGGAGVSAIGSLASGAATSGAARYNQSLANQNAGIAQAQTNADVIRLRQLGVKTFGAEKAAVGASGITMDGSALDVLQESATKAEWDVQNRKYQGALQVAGFQNQASMYGAQARNAKVGSYINAASSLMLGSARYDQMTNNPGTPIFFGTGARP